MGTELIVFETTQQGERPLYWVLDGKVPRPVKDIREFAQMFEGERHLFQARMNEVRISTIFLGIDHQFGDGPPLLFETMIFGGKYDGYQGRTSTWDEAHACHLEAVRRVVETQVEIDWWIVIPILAMLAVIAIVTGALS